jgi:site-specific DNA recombinase
MCSSRLQLKGNCGNVGVNISYLESVVYDVLISTGALADRIKNKDTMIVAVQNEVEKSTNEILTIKKELLDKNKSEERISESYFRLKISQKMFDDNIEIIQNEIENLNKKKINHEKTITSSRKMLKKLETTTSTEKFFANLKNNRKDVIKIFKEYIHKIIITKMDDIYVVCDIFLSIDGVKFIHPIKIFLDQRVPRKKNIVMTYGVAIEMIDHHSFGYNSLLPHMKKGGIADLYNNHPTISFDKIFQKKFKIDGVNKYMVPHENVFSLPITFEKNSKPFN